MGIYHLLNCSLSLFNTGKRRTNFNASRFLFCFVFLFPGLFCFCKLNFRVSATPLSPREAGFRIAGLMGRAYRTEQVKISTEAFQGDSRPRQVTAPQLQTSLISKCPAARDQLQAIGPRLVGHW